MAKEYIEREALLCMVQPDDPGDEMAVITIATAKKLIRSLAHCCPAADVAPVRHGEWLKAEDDYCGLNIIQCSICHEEWCFEIDDDVIDLNYHYCPNCGAKMDKEE